MAPPPTAPGGWTGQASPGAYGAPPPRDYANFGQRLVGYIVDNVIVTLPLIVASAIGCALAPDVASTCTYNSTSYGDTYGSTYPCMQPDPAVWGPFMLVGGLLLVVALYFVIIRPVAATGQSIGRRLMKIRVVDSKTGMPIGTGRSIGRLLAGFFISRWCCSLGYLWMLFNPNKQTWHDLITSSVVVKA